MRLSAITLAAVAAITLWLSDLSSAVVPPPINEFSDDNVPLINQIAGRKPLPPRPNNNQRLPANEFSDDNVPLINQIAGRRPLPTPPKPDNGQRPPVDPLKGLGIQQAPLPEQLPPGWKPLPATPGQKAGAPTPKNEVPPANAPQQLGRPAKPLPVPPVKAQVSAGAQPLTASAFKNVPNLFIEKEHPAGQGKSYTAFVRYKNVPGFMKCTDMMRLFDTERAALLDIHNADPVRLGLSASIKNSFVKLLGDVHPTSKDHCVIFERLNGISWSRFAEVLSSPQRASLFPSIVKQFIGALSYFHRLGWVHGDIKPDNVIISRGADDMPRVTIIDFDLSQKVGNRLAPTAGGTFGYQAPEEFTNELKGRFEISRQNLLDQYRRDSWMTGASIYSALQDMPPYGYQYNAAEQRYYVLSQDMLRYTMAKVASTGTHSCPEARSPNTSLVALMKRLMEPRAMHRMTIVGLNAATLEDVAKSGSKPANMAQIWAKLQLSVAK
ncbi:kinase-like domain-containing protein [Thamnocephalis sphaerospora]|uniref:Kinase-like domain-containing protein n=1 Tax=Thamnocephalis sphaerospora TaxID=78915 RepID=A0A4P9XQH2_9FUNG|nr:kinase-like domain-containing protein [Thamnocephalis sphaerospora]|eukprot:RKP08278.1 kinase-like domain-containing protein [Thamnocephalis sphaerospora]